MKQATAERKKLIVEAVVDRITSLIPFPDILWARLLSLSFVLLLFLSFSLLLLFLSFSILLLFPFLLSLFPFFLLFPRSIILSNLPRDLTR